MTTTSIDTARLFLDGAFTEPRSLRIRDGVIVGDEEPTTPPDRTVDARGGYLLPGLIDAHMHVSQTSVSHGREDLAALARWGVTTGLDMACWPVSFVDEMRGQTGVARLLSATVPAVGPGGNHARLPGFPASGIVTSPREGREFVDRRVDDGADYVKIVTEAEPPEGMDQATVDAIVERSHRHGLLVVAHSVTVGAFDVAIRAGVDVSTHCPVDAVLSDAQVSAMKEQGMECSPTLTMMVGVARGRAATGARYEHARDSVTLLHEAGVPIQVGTDANSAPGAPLVVAHGESLHDELRLLVEAGLTPLEVLTAATEGNARAFGLGDRGSLTPGHRADLLLVGADPLQDVSAARDVRGVWLDGEPL